MTVSAGILNITNVNAFSTASSPGSSITLSNGGTVEFSYVFAQSALNYISSASTGGVVALTSANNVTTNLNFSSSGTVSLGAASGTATFSGSLTPYGATYMLGGGAGALTVSNLLTGSNSLLVGSNGANNTGSVILNTSESFTGTTTINNYTLSLLFSAATAPTTNMLYNGVTPNTLILGVPSGATGGGGTLSISNSTTVFQTFGGLTLNPGANAISAPNTSSVYLTLNGITRNVGSTINFTLASGSVTTTNSNGSYNVGSYPILGGYATVGSYEWAVVGSGAIVTLGSESGYTVANASTSFTANANIDSQATNATALSTMTINSLRFNTPAADTVTINPASTLTIATGGILVTPTVASSTVTITGGSLTSGNGTDLIVFQNNSTTSATIASAIANNGSTSIGLTKSGAGTLILTNSYNSYSGGTFINSGTLQVGATGNLPGGVTLNGGTLSFNSGGTMAYSGSISGSGTVSVANGTVALTGSSSFTSGAGLGSGGVIAVYLLANGGSNSSIGASSNLPAN